MQGAIPEGVEVAAQPGEAGRVEPVDAPVAQLGDGDQGGGFEDLQVLGDGGLADLDDREQLGDGGGTLAQALEQQAAGGIGEGGEEFYIGSHLY